MPPPFSPLQEIFALFLHLYIIPLFLPTIPPALLPEIVIFVLLVQLEISPKFIPVIAPVFPPVFAIVPCIVRFVTTPLEPTQPNKPAFVWVVFIYILEIVCPEPSKYPLNGRSKVPIIIQLESLDVVPSTL